MSTNHLRNSLLTAQAARESALAIRQEALRRRKRNAELRAFFSGGSLVIAGLMLASIYHLLAHTM